MPLTIPRLTYKPIEYQWAYDAWKLQNQLHWTFEEVPMGEDVKDWTTKLTTEEKNLATQILRFFTQADVMVADAYLNHYIPYFPVPEIRMMMAAFASTEAMHIAAYANLNDTLGLPDKEYSAFLEYAEMKAKHDFLASFNPRDEMEVAKTIAAFSAGVEGTQLFASFAILLNFSRHNKLKGVGQIVAWSSKDEHLHANSMIKLFRVFVQENALDQIKLNKYVTEVMHTIVELEDKFIDRAFELGPVQGLTSQEVKDYVRYIGGQRLQQLGYKNTFQITKNPVPWMDAMLSLPEHANFFEQRVTEYAKGSVVGNWNEAFGT